MQLSGCGRSSARAVWALALGLPLLMGARLWAAERLPQVARVAATFDNRPFEYRIEARAERPSYVVYRLTYPSPVVTAIPQNNTVPAAYYLPKGLRADDPKRPAVICMHILDGNDELMRMTCTMLASHGIPAIAFKLPYYGERGPADGPRVMARNPRLLLDALSQGLQDIRRTVDLLASRAEVDPDRIGIMGISLGGIVAGTAAGAEPRLHRAMLILAGGDSLAIIHHARETRDLSHLIRGLRPDDRAAMEQTMAAVDPLRYAPGLRDRARQGRVLMVNADDDEVIPRACTEKLASALGISDRVEWLEGLGHYTALAALPRVMQRMVEFFGQDLPPALRIEPPPPAADSPVHTVLRLVQQALGFLASEPIRGRCHFAEIAVSVTPQGQTAYDGRLLLVRGAEGRFKLQCKLPVVGEVALGQGQYPWMVSAGKKVFKGVRGISGTAGDPLAKADPDHMLRVRMMAGAVAGAAMAPDILDPLVAIVEESAPGKSRVVRLELKGKNRGSARLTLQPDGKSPQLLTFEAPGVQGRVQFLQWQVNTIAPEAIFDPPAGSAEQAVDAEELHRIFAAMFNFAMENAE